MIDATDTVLLQGLDRDVRQSLTQLAKKAHISKEKAHYRLRRLEERGVITGYWGQQRLFSRGAGAYKIFLKDKSLGKRREELIAFLLEHKEAAWIAETEGRWDFIVSCYVSSDHEFTTFAQALVQRFGTALREKTIIKMTKAISLNEKYLHEDKYVRVSEDNPSAAVPSYDASDVLLVNEIAKNARVSYTALARSTGLSAEVVRYRFRKLIKDGAFTDLKIRLNHSALGLSYYHVLLSIEQYESQEAILRYYKQHPQCVYIMTHLGAYDIHLEIVLNPDELSSFVTDLSERFGAALNAYEVLHIAKEHRMFIQQ